MTTFYLDFARYSFSTLLALVGLFTLPGAAHAQIDCGDTFTRAQNLYFEASFEEAVQDVSAALEASDLSTDERICGNLLLARVYLVLQDENRATEALRNIVYLNPAFELDPRRERPDQQAFLTATVEELRRRLPRVTVRSDPAGAGLEIDGIDRGVTPVDVALPPGTYDVSLTLEGYQRFETEVRLREGEAHEVSASLLDILREGRLVVDTAPAGAHVYIDGILLGTTPLDTLIAEGNYALSVVRNGFDAHLERVAISEDEPVAVSPVLTPRIEVRLAPNHGPGVRNVAMERRGEVLVITYDLTTDVRRHDISLEFSSDGGQTFAPVPATLEGHVGRRIDAAPGRQIVWHVTQDFSSGLTGDGNRLRIAASPVSRGGMSTILLGGLAASGAGAAALLLFGGGSNGSENGTTVPPEGLPSPPTRP